MTPRVYLWAAALLAIEGCATAPAPKGVASAAAHPAVLAKFERRLADGRLYIAANLKNTSAATEQAQVICEFQDGNGKPVVPDPAPLKVSLEPGEVLTVHFEAATVAASEGAVSIGP